jgi:putative nucleotidyltransferase with HDIG domain
MTSKGNILAVDDTPASLKLLTDILREAGYDVRSAIAGDIALQSAQMERPELFLLDIRMPEMDGFELCRRLKADEHLKDIPIIFVSALSETEDKVQGFSLGGVDFVTKPYQREELLARVHTHLELRRLRHHLEDMVEERSQALIESEKRLRTSLFDSITALAAMVELRDPYTAGHQKRVSEFAVAIAREMGLNEQMIEGIRLAGVVHDVGKIRVPAEILSKPGALSGPEMMIIREHSLNGFEILRSIDFPWPVAQIVLQHHERLNGSGYPYGLTADELLLEAKIIAVADVAEAMATHRPYRPALGIEAALQEIKEHRGELYDAAVVDVAAALLATGKYLA